MGSRGAKNTKAEGICLQIYNLGAFFMIREDTRVHGQVLVKVKGEGTNRPLGTERAGHREVKAQQSVSKLTTS